MIQQLIERYKRLRTERFLAQTYQCSYAFVGMGQHSLNNLYPMLHYLGVPLKYICVTSERKARLIERKFPYVKATTSLDDILTDETVKGVFVSASPAAHFSIALRVLESGKSLFIETPPCQSLLFLDALIDNKRLCILSVMTSIISLATIQRVMPCSTFTSIPSTLYAICSVNRKSLYVNK